ncbi:hypothetical protein LCGC14_2240620 [marine sediment metagenome]|uniref:Uncharacterized protein n=1 Tax=marine sediment metagenome TaxID=412755 RepID=A0A0F9G0K5_9ZZZZ
MNTRKKRFEGEVRKAWDKLTDLIRTHRTVSINALAAACERENDPRWMQRIQNVFDVFVSKLRDEGVPVVAVNGRCVRFFAEVPVTDKTEALACVQLRGGGAPPAGIRKVLPDDGVLEAHIRSVAELSGNGAIAAIHSAREAEASGMLPAETGKKMAAELHGRLENAAALPAGPTQAALPE